MAAPNRPGPGGLYPWDRWFTQQRFDLVRGVDYTCTTEMMAQQIRNMARPGRYDVRVSIHRAPDDSALTVVVHPHPARKGACK